MKMLLGAINKLKNVYTLWLSNTACSEAWRVGDLFVLLN